MVHEGGGTIRGAQDTSVGGDKENCIWHKGWKSLGLDNPDNRALNLILHGISSRDMLGRHW